MICIDCGSAIPVLPDLGTFVNSQELLEKLPR
jgi:hypothetical protein